MSSQLNPYAEEYVPGMYGSSADDDGEWEDKISEEVDKLNLRPNDETAEVEQKSKAEVVKRDFSHKKEPVNVVFIGHVDAGKSTIGGQLMFLTGMIDKRTLEKYEREAKEKNRESWYLSWALDVLRKTAMRVVFVWFSRISPSSLFRLNDEERQKGKTVEVGRAYFETAKRHYIVLDAPGHKCFVPNMIGGASQADIAILVISARKGEFETGFEKGGQTREHAMLVKTAGVKHLIVLVNKMDDPTVNWDETRFEEIRQKLSPFLKRCGFQSQEGGLSFIPCSGMAGSNLKDLSPCSTWYSGLSLIDYMDSLPPFPRSLDAPFRMPVVDRYKDMGTVVMGKIESGCVRLGDKLVIMPNRTKVDVCQITIEAMDTDAAICGENVKLKLKGVEEEEITSGFILCDCEDVCHVGKVFDAQIAVLDYKSIICPGYSAVMHLHAGVFEVELKAIIKSLGKKPTDPGQLRPRYIKQDSNAIVRLEVADVACMETFQKHPQMGRFTLRDEAKTVAIGKILKIIE